MRSNSILEIKRTFRNKRFLMFTIVIPILIYILLSHIFSFGKSGIESGVSVNFYFLEIIAGMLGNNIFTLATMVTKDKKYYLDMFCISKYNIISWTLDKVIVQIVLNLVIVSLLTIVGSLFLNLHINLWTIEATIIIFLFCMIFSFVGVLLGIYLEGTSVQTIANPIYTVIIIFMLPIEITQYLPEAYIKIQKFFPGYYLWKVIENLSREKSIFNLNLLILIGFGVGIILFCCIFLILKMKSEINR